MIKASVVTAPYYGQNQLFDLDDPIANRDKIYLFDSEYIAKTLTENII